MNCSQKEPSNIESNIDLEEITFKYSSEGVSDRKDSRSPVDSRQSWIARKVNCGKHALAEDSTMVLSTAVQSIIMNVRKCGQQLSTI